MNKKIIPLFIIIICGLICISVGYAAVEHEEAVHEAHEIHKAHETHEAHVKHHYSRQQFLDLLWRALNFFLFVAIIYLATSKRIRTALNAKTEEVYKTLSDLEKAKQAAHQKYLEYEAKLAQLDKEKEKIIQEFIALGEAEKEKILESAQKMAQQIKEAAKRAAEHEAKAAKEHLRAEVAEMATKMAEEIIRKNFKPEDQKKLIEEYLSKIGG